VLGLLTKIYSFFITSNEYHISESISAVTGESHKTFLHGHYHISPQNLKKEIRNDYFTKG